MSAQSTTLPGALAPDEPVADGVVRVALLHLDAAIESLEGGSSVGSVHRARKSAKRARAVLDVLPRGRPLGRRIRDAARELAEVRDADVVRALAVRHELPPPEEAPAALRDRAAARALAGFREARALLGVGAPFPVDPHAPWSRLRRSWERARRLVDGDPHELRKAVKRALHQLELVAVIRPDTVPLTALLDDLQERLGDHHDLILLAELGVGRDGVLARVKRMGRELRRQARVVLAARPADLERWLDR